LYKAIDHYKRFTGLEGYDQLAPHRQKGYVSACYRYSDDLDWIEEQLTSAQGWIAETLAHTPDNVPGTKSTANASPARVLEGTIEVPVVPTAVATLELSQDEPKEVEVAPGLAETVFSTNGTMTRQQLAERIKAGHSVKAISAFAATLCTVKPRKLESGWLSQQDPERLNWVPTDETREYWVKS
jgi:hypothetical protein